MVQSEDAVKTFDLPAGRYVSGKGAAAMLGVTIRRVSQLHRSGKLPAIVLDAGILIPIDAVREREAHVATWDRREWERLERKAMAARTEGGRA